MNFSLDHVIVYVRDLHRAREDWRALGLEATDGGTHPKLGTRNAIVRFPDRSFLELVTIEDREKAREHAPAMVAFVELHPDGPMGWAIRADDLDGAARAVRAAGFRVGPVREAEARRDSGRVQRGRIFPVEEPAFPYVTEYAGPPTSEPSPTGLPIASLAAAIVQGVESRSLAERLARAFGRLRDDGRVRLASGEVVVVEEPAQHPGVIGAELLVADPERATRMLAERKVSVVDGWVGDRRLHGIALRLVGER